MIRAVVHELSHATVAKVRGFDLYGICWPHIANPAFAEGISTSLMHGCATTVLNDIREPDGLGGHRYKRDMIPELLVVAAAGITGEILMESASVTLDTVMPLFRHPDQLGDRTAVRELLRRSPESEDILDACRGAERLLIPVMSSMLREATALTRQFSTVPGRFSGVLYADLLKPILQRILAPAQATMV